MPELVVAGTGRFTVTAEDHIRDARRLNTRN